MSERFRDSVTQNSSVTSSYLRRKRSILPSNTFVLDNDLGNLSDDWWLHIPSDVLPKQRRVSILTDNTVVNNLESPFHDWHRYINRRKAKVPETSYDKSLSDSQHAFVKTENSFHHEKDEGGPGSRSSSPKSNLHQGSADRKSRRRVKHSNNRFKDFSAENSDLGSSSMTVSKQYSANADSSFLRSPVGQDALHVDIREEREEVSKSGEVSLKRTLNDKKNVKGRGSALGLNSMMSPKSMLRNSIEDKVNDNSENFTFQEGDLQGNFQRFTHQNRSRTRNRFRDLQVDDTDITEEMEPRQSVMYNINNDAVVDDEVISRNFEPKYDQEPSNLSVSKGNLQEESSPMENIQGYIKNSSNTKNRFLDLEVIDSDTAELVRTRDSMPNDADEVSNLLFSKTTQSKKSNPENKTLSSNRKTRSNTNNRFCDVDTYDSDSTELMSLSKSTKYNLSNSSNVRNAETSTSVVRNFLNDVEISNGSMGGNNELKHNNSKEKISTSIHKTQGPLKNRFHDLEINDSDTTASIIQLRRSKTNEVSNVLMSTNYRKEKNRRLLAKTHSNTNNHRFRDLEIDDSDTTESLSSSQFMAKNVSDTSNFLASRKNELGKSLSKDKTQVPRQQAFKITENRFIDFQMDDSDSTETSKSRKSILKNVNESSNLFLTENVASQKGYPDGMIQVSTHKATPKNDAKNTKNRFNNINQFVDDSDSSDEEKTEILPTQSPGKSSATNDSIRKPSQSSLMVVHSSGKLPAKSNDSYQLPRSSLINTENNLNLSLEVSDSYSDEEKEKSLSKPKKARHSLRKSKSTDLTSGVKSRNSFVESSSGKSPTRFSSEISLLENSTRKSPKKNSSTVLTSERKSNSSLMENSPRRSPRKNNSTVPTSGRKSSTRLVDSSPRRSLRENNSTVPTSGRKTRSSFVKNSSRQSSSSDRSSISPPGRTSRNSSVENSPRKSPRKNSSTVLTSERKSNSSLMENSPRRSPRKNNSTVPTSGRKSSTRLVDSSPRRSLRKNNSTLPISGRKTRSSFVKNSSRQSSSSDRSTISPPGRTSRNSSVENSPRKSPRKNTSTVLTSERKSNSSLMENSPRRSPRKNNSTVPTSGRKSSTRLVDSSPRRSLRKNNSTVPTSGRKTRSSFVKNSSRQSSSSDRSTISPPGRTSRNSSVENSPRKSPRKNTSTVLTSERKSNSSLMENSPRRSPRKNNSTVPTSERKSSTRLVDSSPRRSLRENNSTVPTSGRKTRSSFVKNSSRQLSSNDRSSISPPGRTSRNSSLENSPSRSQRENNSTVLTSGRKTRSSFVKNFSRQSSSSDRSSISPPGRTSRNSSVENSPRKSPRKNSSTVLTSERKSNSSLMENSPRRSPRKNNSTVLTSGRKTRSSFVKNFSRPSSSSDRSSISPPGRTSRNSSVENSKSGKWKISGRSLEKDSLKQSPLNNSYTILTPGTRSRSSVVGAQSLQKSPGKTNSSLNPSSDQVTEKSPNVSHRMNHISVRMSVGNSLRDIYSLERTPTKSKNYSQFPNQSLRNYKKKLIISPDDSDRSSDEEAEKTLRQSPKETSNSIHSSGRMLKSSVENMHSQETVSIKANSAIKFSDHTSKNDEPPRQSFIKSIKTIHSAGQMSKSSLESLRSLGSLPVKGNNDLKNFDQSLKKMTVMTPDDPSGAQILEKNNLFQSLEDESPTYQAYERSDNVNSLKNYKRSEHFGNAIENPNDFIHSKDSMNLKSSVGVGADKRSQSNLNESSVENRSKKSLDEITELSKGGEIKDNLSVNHQPSGNLNTVSAASLTKSQKQLKVSEQFSRKYDVNKGPSSSVSQSSPIIGTLGSKRRNRKISDHLHRVESASNSNNVHDKLVSGRKQVDTENEDVSEFQKDYIENEVVEVSSNVRTSIQKLSMHALHKSAHDTEMDLIDKNSSATSNFTERLLIPIAQSTIIGSKGSTPKKSTANKSYGSKSALSKKLTRNQGNTSYENSSLPLDEHALANNSSDSEIRSETLSPFQEKMKTLTKSGKISSGIENPVDGSSQRKMRDTKQHVKHESLVKTADAKKGQKEVNKNQRHSFSLQNMSPYHIVADNKKSNDTAKRSSLKRKSSVAVLPLKQSHINYKTTPKALLKSNISEHQRRDSSSSGMSVDDDDALEIDSSDDTMEKHPDIKNLLEEYTQPPKNADVTNHHTRGTLPYYFLPVNAAKTNIKETIPVKRKSTKPAKSVNPDKICDGVVYKKPRLAMPAPWVNKRLYKKVTQAFSADLEENEIVSNIKVEKYILKLHDMVKSVLKHIPSKKKGNGDEKVLAVMRHLYRAKLIRCKMDFYRFCSDYFPEELLIRARLYPFPNGPSIPSPKDGFLSAKYLLMDLNL